ncbi:hypothetical protein ES332_D08G136400v1 [Gossypium tomentosum]|uniref:Uncharacterized protein n=1 Tax=Gossypium tomentosum TaxID=34277 RepID=A0A5D2JWB8_GOSTO|nr:hypothetical protein ES332_D08G136400v1 [Gossypium tomentosum]TYH58183.1 hypothetical protein ES332_D08G136400v1 [Gossypium tomentosum]TYH58186.1 hypothetical protein ES332_D08G136400v1 [Gossypium tomentosum]
MPEEARNRRCKLLLVSLLLVTSYCLKFMVTNLLQRKLFIFLRIEAKLFTVELSSPALVSLFPVLYLPSIPGGVVCKMLKQAIWKVLSERVVLDYGDKLLLPCLYLPTTSFHAGQDSHSRSKKHLSNSLGSSSQNSESSDTQELDLEPGLSL